MSRVVRTSSEGFSDERLESSRDGPKIPRADRANFHAADRQMLLKRLDWTVALSLQKENG